MISGSIARRWAKALFMLAEQENQLLVVSREVKRAAEVWESSDELRTTLENPMLDASVRGAIFSEIVTRMSVSRITRNFLNLLKDKKRISAISAISREFQLLADRRENRIRAEVVSASPLADTVVAGIQASIEAATRKKVVITRREDKSLIGGVVTRVGDLMYDGSLRTQLNRIKEDMLNG